MRTVGRAYFPWRSVAVWVLALLLLVGSVHAATMTLDANGADRRAGITVWGVWDSDSWINQPGKPDWPLLFDANFQPKPALQGFGDALLGR